MNSTGLIGPGQVAPALPIEAHTLLGAGLIGEIVVSRRCRVVAVGGALRIAASSVSGVFAPSHREAPLISGDPNADNTDLYTFVSPDDPTKLTIIANYDPLQQRAGGPNFYPFDESVRYRPYRQQR